MAEGIRASDDLIFVLGEAFHSYRYHVYALDTTATASGDLSIRNLFTYEPTQPYFGGADINFAVCGSKLFAIGAGFDEENNKFLGEFVMWDLGNWKLREDNSFKLKILTGPSGAKPRPIVFVIDDRLYVLSGMLYYGEHDIPSPAFEVYSESFISKHDAKSSGWRSLPEPPPFRKFYSERSRYICGYKVVDTVLYVVFSPDENEKASYYSFDLNTNVWSQDEMDIDKAGTFVTNLAKFGHWRQNEDFDDEKKMFFHSCGTRVIACDLEAKLSNPMRRNLPYYFLEPVTAYGFYDGYPFILVSGLTHVLDRNGKDSKTFGFVAHLDGNIYCAVHLFDDLDNKDDYCQHIHACKFELIKPNGEQFNHRTDMLQAKVLACGHCNGVHWNRLFRGRWYKMRPCLYPKKKMKSKSHAAARA